LSEQHCPNFNLVASTQRASDSRWIMTRLRCKLWSCPVCARKNRQMWRNFLSKKLRKISSVWWFGTLTAPAWARSAEKSLASIRDNFDRFMKRLKRVFGKVEYVRVYEAHKSGAFHVHIVICGLFARVERYKARSGSLGFRKPKMDNNARTWSVNTWWKKTASKCKMGFIAEIKRIPSSEAVGYITKYLTKSAQAFDMPHLRRVQTSRGIGSPKSTGTEIWGVTGHLWGGDIGYQAFVDLDEKKSIPASYWIEQVVYPPDS
jgi:hypothetical protein